MGGEDYSCVLLKERECDRPTLQEAEEEWRVTGVFLSTPGGGTAGRLGKACLLDPPGFQARSKEGKKSVSPQKCEVTSQKTDRHTNF